MKTELTSSAQAAAASATPPRLRYTPKPKGSWKELIGRAKNDDISPEAYKRGAEWRARMNQADG